MVRKRDPYLYPRGCTRVTPLGTMMMSVVVGVTNLQIIVRSVNAIVSGEVGSTACGASRAAMAALTDRADGHVARHLSHAGRALRQGGVVLLVPRRQFAPTGAAHVRPRQRLPDNQRLDRLRLPGARVLEVPGPGRCAKGSKRHGLAVVTNSMLAGACMMCSYVMFVWYMSGRRDVNKLTGRTADAYFYSRILHVALDHQPALITQIEALKVYHFGAQFLVELDIVLDRDLPLHVAHDASELLQRKIEYLPYVERAFVHVDHEVRHSPDAEHKPV